MDDSKLKKIEAELKKARMKRDEWDRKVKDLERKYREAENTCIHDMVHAANLSPEQLAKLEALREAAELGRKLYRSLSQALDYLKVML